MNSTSIRFLAVIGCFVGILATGSTSAEQPMPDGPIEAPVPAKRYRLQYRFRANQIVRYEEKYQSTRTIKTDGLTEITREAMRTKKHFRVISVGADGSGLFELMLDEVMLRVQFGKNKPVVWDSTSTDPVPSKFRPFNDSIGKPRARMRFAKTGELLKATLLNRAKKRAVGQLRVAPPTADNDPSHNFLVVFPEKGIAVGESWTDRISVQVRINRSLLRPVTLMRKYDLVSVDGPLATIRLRTAILTPIRDPDIRVQLIQRTPAGTIVFDIDRGLIVSKATSLNNREVGLSGGRGAMHIVIKRTETLIDPTETAHASKASPK